MSTLSDALTSHRPRKRFGQHFLQDRQVLARVAQVACAGNPCNLLEIGPGMGALTEALLEHMPRITAVELDRDLVSLLNKRFGPDRLHVVQMDILGCDLATLPRVCPELPLRVVGNLPYNISTPLLFHLLDQRQHMDALIFMVQKEVAARLTANPGEKAYGKLTVMVALEMECDVLFDVLPAAFSPPPKVHSSLVYLRPRTRLLTVDPGPVRVLLSVAFSQRRKILRNALKNLVTSEEFDAAGIDSSLRAEALSPEDYVRLALAISHRI